MAPERDRKIEAQLRESAPEIDWSVKNQTRLHWRDGDAPYGSATDAMRQWPETAPSTAVCCVDAGSWELAALLGIGDLVTGDLCVGAQFSCEPGDLRKAGAGSGLARAVAEGLAGMITPWSTSGSGS